MASGSGKGMANKSCGTCRDRRILCDRATPTCVQCSRSKRNCKGYGLRLSWPDSNDRRRTAVAKVSSSLSRRLRNSSDSRLINVSAWDIEMHHYLSALVSDKYIPPLLRVPMPFSGFKVEAGDSYLFEYFHDTASRSLTTFGHDPTKVGNILMRMALANNSPSASAVLQALLALSSLHRYGMQGQAAEYKISALRSLTAASNNVFGGKEAIQHVATGMLLCSFEIQMVSCTSSQWKWYICGVKKIIRSASLNASRDSDFNTMINWVYYHDVLSSFSLRHWNWDPANVPPGIISNVYGKISHAKSSIFNTILELLLEVCETVSTKPPPKASPELLAEHINFLQLLDWRISRLPIATTATTSNPDASKVMELFQLAILVYLSRATGTLLDNATKTQQRIDRAFALFSQLGSCERQFPLFVLGCEARTDEQRIVVLDLMDRTEKSASSRSLMYVSVLVQKVWAQDDLAAEKELGYLEKLGAIISCCVILPTFV